METTAGTKNAITLCGRANSKLQNAIFLLLLFVFLTVTTISYAFFNRKGEEWTMDILEHRKFCTKMRKNFFTLRVTEHWNKLLRMVAESPLEIIIIIIKTGHFSM